MTLVRFSLLAVISLLATPAVAQLYTIPPGAYRTAAAYHRRQPQPAGSDATYPDKRGQLVVEVPRGPKTEKLRVSPDSVWGYVSGKGRTFRIYRGEEYRLEHTDTLCVYTRQASITSTGLRPNASGQQNYFFSLGLNGLVFPLTVPYLRELFAASNPAFVKALSELSFSQSLADFDRKTGLYRVTSVYREASGKR
ncbi:hypothetical protein [Hymenobacter daeguensis]